MRELKSLSDMLVRDQTFALDEHGQPITRERKCLCGRAYTQRLLSERTLAVDESQGRRAVEQLSKQTADGYVPLYCPSCERRELARKPA
jgi:hypothetical protein